MARRDIQHFGRAIRGTEGWMEGWGGGEGARGGGGSINLSLPLYLSQKPVAGLFDFCRIDQEAVAEASK